MRFLLFLFCLFVVALNVCRATNKVWGHECLCSSCSLQKYLERWRAALKEDGRSAGVNEGTQDPESWTQYSSLVTALFTVYAQLTPAHLTWGLLRVCAAGPTPCLNLRFELRPSWNNIHNTFPTGTAQDTTLDLTDKHRDMSLLSEAISRHQSSRITLSPKNYKAKRCINLPRFVCQNKQLNLNRHVQGSNPNCRLKIHCHFQKTSTRYSVRFLSYLLQSAFIFSFSPALNQSFDSCELILFVAGSYGSVHKASCYNLLATFFAWRIVCNENKHSFPS